MGRLVRALVGGILLVLAGGVGAPAVAERPLEAFATLPRFTNPNLSPNGELIAAEMSFEGRQQLVVIPTDPSKGQPILIGAGDYDIWDISWVNDEWLIVQAGIRGRVSDNRFVQGEEAYISRYIAFRADGKEQHILEPRNHDMEDFGGEVIWIADDGSPEILLQYRTSFYSFEAGGWPKVMRVDVSKNRFKLDTDSMIGIDSFYADSKGVVRVGTGPAREGLKQRFVYRWSADERLKEVTRVDADDDLLAPRLFFPDGRTAMTYSSKDGYRALYKLDLRTMSLGDKIFGVAGYDVSGWSATKTGDGLAGVRWIDTTLQYQWFEPEMQDAQTQLSRAFPGKFVRIVSADRARDKLLITVGTPAEPPSYYLFDTAKKKVSLIAQGQPQLAQGPNGAVTTVVYAARDGLAIPAILTLPPGREPKNLPLIVLPHGGPQARDYESWDWWAQFLADRGYVVLQPNYRGSEGFGEEYLKRGDGEWGLKMQDDIVDAKAWAVEKGLADPDRACVVGASYGGYVAMRAAQRDYREFRCAVSFAGVSDLPAMLAGSNGSWTFGRYMAKYWHDRTGDLSLVSPLKHPEEFGMPILLVHGKKDQRVPVEQSRDLAQKLEAAHKQVEYVEQPEGDHHFSRIADRKQFLEVMERFLDKYNPAD